MLRLCEAFRFGFLGLFKCVVGNMTLGFCDWGPKMIFFKPGYENSGVMKNMSAAVLSFH